MTKFENKFLPVHFLIIIKKTKIEKKSKFIGLERKEAGSGC
jgi:hypothetical protein